MGRLIGDLDIRDRALLKEVLKGSSIREMANAIGVRSSNTVHERLTRLIADEFVIGPPKPKQARGWKLTELGMAAVEGYVPRKS